MTTTRKDLIADPSPYLETQLYEIGKWAFRSLQYVGYLPIAFRPWHGFRIRWRSLHVLRCLTLILLSLAWNLNYLTKRRRFARFLRVFGSTELFTHTLMVASTACVGTFYRLSGLLHLRPTVQFWKENCLLIQRITRGPNDLDRPIFQRIRTDLKRAALIFYVPSVLHVLGFHSYYILEAWLKRPYLWQSRMEFFLGSGLWVWLAFFHVGYSLWMIFFIKLYTVSFQLISESLEELCEEVKPKPPEIYYAEIFSGKVWPRDEEVLDARVRDAIELFHGVERQVKGFNRFFATKLIFEMLHCIVSILAFSFFACLWVSRGVLIQLVPLIVPLFLHNAELYQLGTVSWRLTKAAQRIVRNFQNLPLQKLSLETQIRIQLLVTSISTNPPTISAGHFFILNRTTITSILCAMTTFLVVLVQFKEADNTSILPPIINGTQPVSLPSPPQS